MTAVQEKPQTVGSKILQGKVAVVTGGSRGIGAAIAEKLAAEGAKVVFSYNNNTKAAEDLVKRIEASGSKAVAVKANVSSKTDGQALLAEAAKLGKVDILVNNAAIFEFGPIDSVPLEQYDKLFDTNVRGLVATTIATLPHMNEGGRIINISSGAARAALPGFSLYSGTKGAIETFTRVWAQDLGKRKITVNAVAPGTTETDMLRQGLPAEAIEGLASKTALGRLGTPNDIAEVVLFLASDAGRWVTGQTIDADGGISI